MTKLWPTVAWTAVFLLGITTANHQSFPWKTRTNNIAYYADTIYLGVENGILRLDSNLTLLANVSTGPVKDNPRCILQQGTCHQHPLEWTDNINKLLLVYSNPDVLFLITCGSIFNGVCDARNLTTLAVIKDITNQFVASIRKDETTVGVISNGPSAKQILYVGSTIKDRNVLIGSKLGTVTARILDLQKSLFRILEVNNLEHRLVISEQAKGTYFIDYILAFSNVDYTYFTTVQPISTTNSNFHSKIVRICNKDTSFYSYSEIPLQCKKNSVDYNILISATTVILGQKAVSFWGGKEGDELLIGLFATSTQQSKEPMQNYAICMFTVKDVNTVINENIKSCLTKGNKLKSGLSWTTTGSRDCLKITSVPESAYCMPQTTFPIGGATPITGSATWNEQGGTSYHSVAAVSHPRGLTVYVGNSDGQILKLEAISSTKLQPFALDTTGDSSPVHKISVHNMALHALTDQTLTKLLVRDCNERATCQSCLSGPYCGWCSLANKCSEMSACATASLTRGFIDQAANLCPIIIKTSTKQISVNIASNITLQVRNLPELGAGAKYICSFNGKIADATRVANDFTCDVPKAVDIPGVSLSQTATAINVSLQADSTRKNVVASAVVLYNCNAISRCFACTSGIYKCDWCTGDLQCVDNAERSCEAGTVSIPYGGLSSNSSSTQCPVVLSTTEKFIPFGQQYSVSVKGRNLPAATGKYGYKCEVDVGGQLYSGIGLLQNGSIVKCKEENYVYGDNVASLEITVRLLYGGQALSALPLNVTLFKCSHKRDDCSICADAPPLWKCGWCLQEQKCSVVSACSQNWTGRICPVPVISLVDPSSGSVGGNTTVIIIGRDLGTYISDIVNITVAGYPCRAVVSSYVQSKQISCLTAAASKPVIDGSVVVHVKGDNGKLLKGEAKRTFSYKQPVVLSFAPLQGPCSGGTTLNVNGTDLNVGRTINVYVDRQECLIDTSNSESIQANRIICKTSAGQNCVRRRRQIPDGVVVSFDGYHVPSQGAATFAYKPDPSVTDLSTNTGSTPLETFVSGGQAFNVEGQGFVLVASPRLIFTFGGNISVIQPKACTVLSDTELQCYSPNFTHVVGNANSTSAMAGLVLDNVASALQFRQVTIKRDPIFYKFPEANGRVKELKTGDLILEGINLELLSKEDVHVTIGNRPCAVTSLDQRLVCTAPTEAEVKNGNEGATPAVTVFVGNGGLRYDLGVIQYYKVKKTGVPLLLYIALSGGALVLILIILVLICLYRRRHRKEKEYLKIYQTQMDNLESRYARECKEAFADLQTEITDLTTDLAGSVPYLKFDSYSMQVLFPGIEHHPGHEKDCNKSDAWKRGMTSLCSLMKQEEFLLLFIRMLEGQPSFLMRDRCIVASLLMMVLQDDLKYTTNILIVLLTDLIKKSVANGRPKLLLRRTESVAEKLLTNWLAYSLHGYLEEYVGEPLFHLCAAISALLDKEPVDAITSDARNSLSEDKLLRQKVDFQVLTVSVEYVDQDAIQVQVLNCDTIGQCKEKILNVIYKNAPYSERPSKDHLELSWVQPSGATVILQDEDNTNQVDGEWRRLNTLQHYQVPDNCLFKLAAPQSAVACAVITGSPVMHNSSMPSVLYLPNHSSVSALNNGMESSLKPWHLVKASDFPVEQSEDTRQSKMMAEVYLTRLLKTKGTLQNFVTDLFDSIFVSTRRRSQVPPPVKFLFDFLDKQALANNVTDEEVLHTWKNNSLPLRFWINVIKNPNFVFDIHKSSTVDSCLSVIAQLFMDSCSPDEHRLGKDSPSNKLLYAREIPEYKKRVARFYADVQNLPPVSEDQLNVNCAFISKKYGAIFNQYNAMSELLGYAVKYKVKLMDMLEFNDLKHLADELQEIMESLPDD